MKKRVLSMLMALVLCLTLLPTAAFAEGADGGAASRETITVEGGQPTATGAPTEGGGQLTNTGEGEQPNSETDMRTEICCVGKPDSIGRSYDGTTDGGTIPIDLTFQTAQMKSNSKKERALPPRRRSIPRTRDGIPSLWKSR